MAFDAGAIEATLTLNRNPFTAGLAAAKAQVDQWKKRNTPIEVDVKVNLKDAELKAIEAKLKKFGTIVAKATAEIVVKGRAEFDRLLVDLKWFDKRKFSAQVDVDTARASVDVIAFRTLLSTLNDQTVNLSTNTRSFGSAAGAGFGEGQSHFQKMATAIIAALPVIASLFTATVGAVGALAGSLLIAGLGAGAFALVAVPAFKQVKAAVAAGQAEIDKLPPGLREAGNAMQGLNTAYNELVKQNQRITGIALASWFNAGTAALKTLNPLVDASAKAFANVGDRAKIFFEGVWWKNFVSWLTANMMPVVSRLGSILFSLIEIVGNLTRAFMDLGGSKILDMITQGLAEFALWTDKIGQNKTFQMFMDSAVRSLPVVGALIRELLEFIIKLAIGLEPLGTLIIRIFTGILEAINSLPIPVIQGIALAIAAVWAAMALGATGPVGLAIGVLAGLAAIFVHLAETNDSFRASIDRMLSQLRADFIPIWDTIVNNFNTKIKPAWDSLVDTVQNRLIPALQRFGSAIYDEVMPKIQPFVDVITGQVIPAVLGFLETIAKVVSFLVDVFGPTVARELGAAVTVFQGAFQTIAGLLNVFTGVFTGDWTTFTTGIRQITEGFWTIIAGMFGTNLDGLRTKIQEWDAWIDNTWRTFWNGITSFFSGVWATMQNIWSAALALLQGDVSRAADQIGQAWRRVANFFRDPINWVIRTVIGPPGGLAGAWNTVMGWIGQPQLNVSAPPQIPAFAQGGRIGGPGSGTSDSILARVSNGEYIIPEKITKKIWPFLDALRAGQTEALQAAGAFLGSGAQFPAFAGGGVVEAQNFARSQGGPYVWGGVGPNGYDCSGFMSAVANVALGQYPYRRRFATASFGPNRGAGGFVPGLNSAFGIGVNPSVNGGAGHMAGTIGGLNAESSGGRGAHTGPSARGATNGLFPWKFSLPQAGGAFIDGGGGGAPPVSWWSIIANQVTSLIKGLFSGSIPGAGGVIGQAMNKIPVALIDKTIAALKEKLDKLMTAAGSAINTTAQGLNQNPLSGMGTADRGAIIPPGASTVFNATGKPEPLTNLDVYERMKPVGLTIEDVLSILNSNGGGTGGSGDTYNVMLPERASVRELADSLDFKRRVVSKGRYSR